MKEVALFYGTYTGVTGQVAQKIVNELGADKVDLFNISKDGDKMSDYKKLIIGTSTWSIGELQEDWDAFMPKLQKMDFSGKTVALFGMGMLYETFQYRGAEFIGFWPTQGYDFTSPLPLLDHDHFVGLAIDEDNQPELTDERIKQWCDQIRADLGL